MISIPSALLASLLLMQTPAPAPAPAPVDVRVSTTADLLRALGDAAPGTRILLATGNYDGFHATNVRGTAERPILLAAADPAAPPVFRGGVQLSRVAYVHLEHLRIEGAPANGLNIDDGGALDDPSTDVVLRGLEVRDCGGRANHDGIKLSGVVDFRVESCTVERWGRGGSAIDMVGCRRGAIEACTFRDRETDAASSGVQAKGGSSEIAIRRCRFEHAGERAVNLGGSTGLAYFRPKPAGFEARDLVVEGCTFIGSSAPVAFVGVDGATVRFNTIYRPRRWVARILQETREPGFVPCRGGVVADNIIVYRASEVRTSVNVGDATAPESFRFARNYWYCEDDPARTAPALPAAEVDPRGGRDPRFIDAAAGDLTLAPDSPARAHGAGALPPAKGN